jgi:hypothetical protein
MTTLPVWGVIYLMSFRLKRSVEAYANKCLSAFYNSVDDKKPLKTFDVFHRVHERYPTAAHVWLSRLESVSKTNILEIFNRIPNTRISTTAELSTINAERIERLY